MSKTLKMGKLIFLGLKMLVVTIGIALAAISYFIKDKDMSVFQCFILLTLTISIENELKEIKP